MEGSVSLEGSELPTADDFAPLLLNGRRSPPVIVPHSDSTADDSTADRGSSRPSSRGSHGSFRGRVRQSMLQNETQPKMRAVADAAWSQLGVKAESADNLVNFDPLSNVMQGLVGRTYELDRQNNELKAELKVERERGDNLSKTIKVLKRDTDMRFLSLETRIEALEGNVRTALETNSSEADTHFEEIEDAVRGMRSRFLAIDQAMDDRPTKVEIMAVKDQLDNFAMKSELDDLRREVGTRAANSLVQRVSAEVNRKANIEDIKAMMKGQNEALRATERAMAERVSECATTSDVASQDTGLRVELEKLERAVQNELSEVGVAMDGQNARLDDVEHAVEQRVLVNDFDKLLLSVSGVASKEDMQRVQSDAASRTKMAQMKIDQLGRDTANLQQVVDALSKDVFGKAGKVELQTLTLRLASYQSQLEESAADARIEMQRLIEEARKDVEELKEKVDTKADAAVIFAGTKPETLANLEELLAAKIDREELERTMKDFAKVTDLEANVSGLVERTLSQYPTSSADASAAPGGKSRSGSLSAARANGSMSFMKEECGSGMEEQGDAIAREQLAAQRRQQQQQQQRKQDEERKAAAAAAAAAAEAKARNRNSEHRKVEARAEARAAALVPATTVSETNDIGELGERGISAGLEQAQPSYRPAAGKVYYRCLMCDHVTEQQFKGGVAVVQEEWVRSEQSKPQV